MAILKVQTRFDSHKSELWDGGACSPENFLQVLLHLLHRVHPFDYAVKTRSL